MILKCKRITSILLSSILALSILTSTGCGKQITFEEINKQNNNNNPTTDLDVDWPNDGTLPEEDYCLFGWWLSESWENYHGAYRSIKSFFNYDIDYDNVKTWNALSDIDESSVEYRDDNTVIFKAKGPDGKPVRFWGYDVTVGEDEVTLHKTGVIVSLDSVGRIFSADPIVSQPGDSDNWINTFGAYDINFDTNPDSPENFVYTVGYGRYTRDYTQDPSEFPDYSLLDFQPNFIGVGCDTPFGGVQGFTFKNDVVLSDIYIVYEEDNEPTKFREVFLDSEFYGYYLEGERYDMGREVYDPKNGIFNFYMWAVPDLKHEKYPFTLDQLKESIAAGTPSYTCNISDCGKFEVQGIKGSDNSIRDRSTAKLSPGDSVVVKMGKQTFDVKPEILPLYTTANTMHDLVPYAFPEAKGDLKVLAIPIAWQDEPENATDANLDEYRAYLGKVIDESGNIVDHTSELPKGQFSLSDYFDQVSYGKFSINTYMTDWYQAPYNFTDYREQCLDEEFFKEVLDWMYGKYPNIDFGSFDQDNNGYFDAVIFMNSGSPRPDGSYNIISFEGAICYRQTYGSEYAGTHDKPCVNGAVTINRQLFSDNTLIHEFSHILGLIDYYDVRYTGINAVGGYDMQSNNYGDWNAYSKYSVGWIEPTIVQNLKEGESVDVEIGVMSKTGDMIAIPAVGSTMDDPFTEYLMVDLFDDVGVNALNAHQAGIDIGARPGVRIYHVDARMEYRDYVSSMYPDMKPCPIGTIHFANAYSANGFYNIELLQRGAKNTFTNLDNQCRYVNDSDFFQAGDVFTVDKYKEFFFEGKFDDGSDFGYSVEVVSISGSGEDAKAVIRITRQ